MVYYAPTTEVVQTKFYQDSTLTNPTTVTATVMAPDGTTSTPTPTNTSTGIYETKVQMTTAGRWQVKITGTTSGDSVTTYYSFDVVPTALD